MKRVFITLALLGAVAFNSCESGLPLPSQPDKEQEKEDGKDNDKEDSDEGKEEKPKQIVVNGTVIDESTNLYGVVTNTQSGAGIPNIVVSDG